jgi:hypothetical protein
MQPDYVTFIYFVASRKAKGLLVPEKRTELFADGFHPLVRQWDAYVNV